MIFFNREPKINRQELVKNLNLSPGDILHIKLGMEMGDLPPWIPDVEDLEAAKIEWEKVVPKDVKVIVTHLAVDTNILKVANDANSLKKQTIAISQAKLDTYNILRKKGLPIPPDLRAEIELSQVEPGEAA